MQADKRILIRIFIGLTICLYLWFLSLDAQNSHRYAGVDLRNRVVGSRLISLGYDPYYFRWDVQYHDTLLDPADDPRFPVSRVTVPPTVLLAYSGLSQLPYMLQRNIWLIVQWIALLITIILFALRTNSKKAMYLWIGCLLLVVSNDIWRMHVERGQLYILYVMMISLAYFVLSSDYRYKDLLSGIIIGYASSLRPTFIFLLIPYLRVNRPQLFLGAIGSFLSSISLSIMAFGIRPWYSYGSAMKIQEKIHLGEILVTGPNPSVPIAEGMHIKYGYPFFDLDTSIQGLFKLVDIQITSNAMISVMAILFITVYFCLIHNKRFVKTTESYYLAGVMFVMIAEYFIPASRYFYYNVIWLLPLGLIIIMTDNFKLIALPCILLLISSLLLHINSPITILIGCLWIPIIICAIITKVCHISNLQPISCKQ